MKNVKSTKPNRQALRSRQMLQDALLELLRGKPFKKIKITDITEHANLSRATFYAHFETKDELLLSYVDDVLDQFFGELRARAVKSGDQLNDRDQKNRIAAGFPSLFAVWREHSDTLKLVRSEDIDMQILKRLREFHSKLYFENAPKEQINPNLDAYLLEVLSGVSFGLLTKWADEGMKHSPEVMGQLMQAVLSGPIFGPTKQAFDQKIK